MTTLEIILLTVGVGVLCGCLGFFIKQCLVSHKIGNANNVAKLLLKKRNLKQKQ